MHALQDPDVFHWGGRRDLCPWERSRLLDTGLPSSPVSLSLLRFSEEAQCSAHHASPWLPHKDVLIETKVPRWGERSVHHLPGAAQAQQLGLPGNGNSRLRTRRPVPKMTAVTLPPEWTPLGSPHPPDLTVDPDVTEVMVCHF